MIELGLEKGQEFKSDAHRQVASAVGLGNPNVTGRDTLTQIVQIINNIPNNQIKKLTFYDLKNKYNCPGID